MTSQKAGKHRPGESVVERGREVSWGPTRKAWNVKIRAWKSGVMPGLQAVQSRKVGAYGNKKQEMGEEIVRMETEKWRVRGVGEASRGEGGGTGWGLDPVFTPAFPRQSPSSPLLIGLPAWDPAHYRPACREKPYLPFSALF